MKLKKKLEELPFYNQVATPYRLGKAVAAGVKYGRPGRKIRVIGVTGTNGKTTTCFMIWKMLNEAGYKTGLLTTVAWGVDKLKPQREHMTTVGSFLLNERICEIEAAGAEFLVMEVTSHALTQFRTLWVPIEIAVMTNVTHEHLDYHGTFAKYLAAKCRLFTGAKYGVINADDKSAARFREAILRGVRRSDGLGRGVLVKKTDKYITYGIKNGKMRAKAVKLGSSGVKYACGDINIEVKIPGEFNVYNSLAALCVGKKLGLSDKEIKQGLAALSSVEGRMNKIELGQNFQVIVDFAHTPDAFLKVFTSVSSERRRGSDGGGDDADGSDGGGGKKQRVIALFGGAGRRDESTRFERGLIAGKYSDVVIVTEDDSRDEDPEKIAAEFIRGAEAAGLKRVEKIGEKVSEKANEKAGEKVDEKAGGDFNGKIIEELDRKKAINLAVRMAKPGDLVLILGKGHEKTIIRADGAHDFEDLKVTAAAIKKLLGKKEKK